MKRKKMGKRSIFKIIKEEVEEEKRMMEGKNSERERHILSLYRRVALTIS